MPKGAAHLRLSLALPELSFLIPPIRHSDYHLRIQGLYERKKKGLAGGDQAFLMRDPAGGNWTESIIVV